MSSHHGSCPKSQVLCRESLEKMEGREDLGPGCLRAQEAVVHKELREGRPRYFITLSGPDMETFRGFPMQGSEAEASSAP